MSERTSSRSRAERLVRARVGQLLADLRVLTVGPVDPRKTWAPREDLRFRHVSERSRIVSTQSRSEGGAATSTASSGASLDTAVLERAPQHAAPGHGTSVVTRTCRIVGVDYPAQDSVAIWMERIDGGEFEVRAGQFFTLCVDVNGVTYRRAYSVANDLGKETGEAAPHRVRAVRLSIKRVANGVVSNELVDRAAVGNTIQVLGPSGHFGENLLRSFGAASHAGALQVPHVLCIAGGSGITPMLSIVPDLLRASTSTRVTMIVGNRTDAHTLFRSELERLALQHADRLRLIFAVEDEASRSADVLGRLDRTVLSELIASLKHADEDTSSWRALLCGPEGMRHAAQSVLMECGVPASSIEEERFDQPHLRSDLSLGTASSQPVTLRIGERRAQIVVAPGQTILEAGLAAGVELPYSCTMGGCGACALKAHSGETTMAEPNCLSQQERRDGVVLACIASPMGPCELEVPA